MRSRLAIAMIATAGCAPAVFHEGRSTLAEAERAYLGPGRPSSTAVFQRFWQSPNARPWGIVRWEQDRSSACARAPAGLLQSMREEIGRLNRAWRAGESITLAVTVYRYDEAGMLGNATAHYELVARDPRGQVVWAVDDKVGASAEMARSLADTASAIISREVLRRLCQQFGLFGTSSAVAQPARVVGTP